MGDDRLRLVFACALADAYPAAKPDPEGYELEFASKVKPAAKAGPSAGGCG